MTTNISNDVFILSAADLRQREDAAFQRGVARGRFEASFDSGKAQVAQNCAHWHTGECQVCGVQWQYNLVGHDFACPHFAPRSTTGGGE